MSLPDYIAAGINRAFKAGLTDLDPPITLNHTADLRGTYDVETGAVTRTPVTVSVECVAVTITQEDVDNGYAPDKAGRKFLIEKRALDAACVTAGITPFVPQIEHTRAIHDGTNYALSKVRVIPGKALFILFGRVS